jgi:peptidoglycan/xylan/chitin deacetylase (PgdA/CDA1 family)
MSALRFIRLIVSLTVFSLFVYLASQHQHFTASEGAAKESNDDTASITTIAEPHPTDLRELALELPDTLLPFCRGLNLRKEIALSFDACPTGSKNQFSRAIADILLETKTPATIFLSGSWVKHDTAATRLLASDSLIELGNHSYTHPHLLQMSIEKMRQELERTQEIINSLTGQRPFLFRAPYGEVNDTLVNVARELGLATVQFDVESGDPDTAFTSEKLIKWVTEKSRNGSIVIMHINNRGWHTAQALPAIIQFLRDKGYELVKVSALMKEVSAELSLDVLAHADVNRNKDLPNGK